MFGVTSEQKFQLSLWFLQWFQCASPIAKEKAESALEACKCVLQTCGSHGSTGLCVELFTTLLRAQVAHGLGFSCAESFEFDERINETSAGLPKNIAALNRLQTVPYRTHLRANVLMTIDLCYEWKMLLAEQWMESWMDELLCFWQDVVYILGTN